jgi:selenocysteine lyase/cysteine desulfurase
LSIAIVAAAHAAKIAIRYGNMYSYRMCVALGIDTHDGVVRISMVHYNTMDEVERLIKAFDTIF